MKYKIRIHIAEIDGQGRERDMGPWPEQVAQTSQIDEALDLCTLLSHHLRSFLFPKDRAS